MSYGSSVQCQRCGCIISVKSHFVANFIAHPLEYFKFYGTELVKLMIEQDCPDHVLYKCNKCNYTLKLCTINTIFESDKEKPYNSIIIQDEKCC